MGNSRQARIDSEDLIKSIPIKKTSDDHCDQVFFESIMDAVRLSRQGKGYKLALKLAKKNITPEMRKILFGSGVL